MTGERRRDNLERVVTFLPMGSRGMETTNISIEVDAAAARAYTQASEDDRRRLQLLLSLRLRELTSSSSKSLKEVLDDVGANAEARGLTPELLDSILHDG